jgi:two-component system CheB/CheR fusion protein
MQLVSIPVLQVPYVCSSLFIPRTDADAAKIATFRDRSAGRDKHQPLALVVDDVADVTEMISLFLSHAGFKVVTAESAAQALAFARTEVFDVIVSDIGMPVMNGYQLAEALRELPDYQDVPMIAVTGFSMYDDRERAMQSGFNAHLVKPIDPSSLLDLITELRR